MSLDGRIADAGGRARWVSGPEAREWAHWLRAGYDALAVAAGTARADDPALTVRGAVTPLRPPLRVLFDRRAELPASARLIATAREVPTLVIVAPDAPAERRRALEAAGAEVLEAHDHGAALAALWTRGVAGVLVEGGGVLAGRLLAADLVDRVHAVVAPLLLGEGAVMAFGSLPGTPLEGARRWHMVERRALGEDQLLTLDRT
jgi:diaminohydroxyphosphoribosylaminopyrimidine deaminase/5-amino-6-(5-phosphoribosylamino)uracil reductase